MKAVLTHEPTGVTGRPKRSVVRLPEGKGRIGPDPGCDLQIADLPPGAITIEQQERTFQLQTDFDLQLNEHALSAGESVTLHNGDEVVIGAHRLTFNVEFERVGQAKRVGLLPTVSVVLIVLLLLVEIAVSTWLPHAVGQSIQWGEEIARQRTYGLMDALRRQVGHQLRGEEAPDLQTSATLALLAEELDRMAFYVRQHEPNLTGAQLDQIYADLIAYHETLTQLRDGTFYPTQQQLSIEPAVEYLLQE